MRPLKILVFWDGYHWHLQKHYAYMSIIKWAKPNSFVPFNKSKDLKLEIEMACNHCTKFMVYSDIWLVQYIFIIKFSFFEFYNLFLYLSKSNWKKITYSDFYNLFIYQFQWWSKTM
jgi:hypothetical protein